MNETSKTSCRPISTDTTNAISSPASADGPTPCASPAGQTTGLSGPAHVRANLSARQAEAQGLLTSGTFGPTSTISSPSVVLQSCLASRLRQRLEGLGSPLFALTWKEWHIEWGPPICALRASGRRTSGNGCGGWPTPTKGNADGSQMAKDASATGRRPDGTKATVSLHQVATLAGWPTPRANDGTGAKIPPRRTGGMALKAQAAILGPTSSGSPAGTEKPGQLNPAFSLWLMGFPTEWARCAARVTRSSRKRRPSSSEPTKKPASSSKPDIFS